MDSNAPLPEIESTPLKANQIMRQPDGKDGEKEIFKTFNEWANIRDLHPGFGQDIAQGSMDEAIPLSKFKDVLSEFFSDQKKIKDADKIFPRESRIEAIKQNLLSGGKTPAPENYNVGDAQWKFHNKNNFQYHPDQELYLEIGTMPYLTQLGDFLYATMKEKEQDLVKNLWRKQKQTYKKFFQAPVTAIEDSYSNFIQAHIYNKAQKNQKPIWAHHGRDETFDQLKRGISTSFSKLLVQNIINACPGCEGRVKVSSETGKKREASKRKADQEAQQVAPTKKHRSQKYANLSNAQIENHGFAEMNLPMDYHNQNQPDNAGTMYAGYNYPVQDQPVPWGTINPGYNQFVQNQPGLFGTMAGNQYRSQPQLIGSLYNGFDPSQNQPGPFGTTTGNQYQPQPQFYAPVYNGFDASQNQPGPSSTTNAGFAYPVQDQPALPGTMYTGAYPQANYETFVNDGTIDPDLTQSIAAFDYELDTPEQRLFTMVGAFNRINPDTNSTLPPTQYTQYPGPNETPSVPPSDYAIPKQSFEPSTAVPDSNSSTSEPTQNGSPDQLLDFVGAYHDIGPDVDNNEPDMGNKDPETDDMEPEIANNESDVGNKHPKIDDTDSVGLYFDIDGFEEDYC